MWHVDVDNSVESLGRQGFTLDNGTLYVGEEFVTGLTLNPQVTDAVFAYRARDGALLWQKSGGTLGLLMSAANGVVYSLDWVEGTSTWTAGMATLTYKFSALRGSDGTELWKTPIVSSLALDTPVVANGAVYIAAIADVFALSASDGSVLWHYRGPDQPTCSCAHFVSAGDGQVFRTEINVVTLSAANGTVKHTMPVTSPAWRVSYGDGALYTALIDDHLIATQASDSKQLWSMTLHPGGGGVVAVSSNAPYVSSRYDPQAGLIIPPQPGVLYALRPADGSVVWQFQAPGAGILTDPVVG
jgi:outer membrane protein assembly factor BamB